MDSISLPGLAGVLLAILIIIIQRVYRGYRERQVRIVPQLFFHAALTRLKSDQLFGRQHGCLPPPRLINEKPLGIDRLHQIWEANSDSRLMELFLWHFRRWGNTLDQVFLSVSLQCIGFKNQPSVIFCRSTARRHGSKFGSVLRDQ
jgi:hypothetical protein